MPTIGVVVPAYRADVDELDACLHSITEIINPETLRVELDEPEPAVIEYLSTSTLELDINTVPYRRGKGAAITAGFEALDTDWYAFTDADGSTPASELDRILDALARNEIAIGSRRHPNATVFSHQTYFRRFLGDMFAWLARRLLETQVFDYQCGAKAIRATAWEEIRPHLYEPGFGWDIEFLAVAGALEVSVTEVPIDWEDKPGSTVSPIRSGVAMARTLFRARHRSRRLRSQPQSQKCPEDRAVTALIHQDR